MRLRGGILRLTDDDSRRFSRLLHSPRLVTGDHGVEGLLVLIVLLLQQGRILL